MKGRHDFKKGIYRHYKGKLYEVLGIAFHSESEEELVIYKMLYTTEKHPEGTLWARPKEMFLEEIIFEGKAIPRFEYIEGSHQ